MSTQTHVVDHTAAPVGADATDEVPTAVERDRPKVSGDLADVLGSAPMFRRAVAGYDRFEVDTYVRWAEEELATAEREREHLMVRHLNTVAALDDARRLLDHSSSGRELLGTSQRIGTLLAAAADEADGIRADAQAERAAAAEAAARLSAEAAQALAAADDEAARRLALAAEQAAGLLADARATVEDAERTGAELRAEAERYLAEARLTGRLAEEDADRLRQRAAEHALASHEQARQEIVRMLAVGREERRRADEEAAGERRRLDDAAAARRSALLAETEALEARLVALRAEAAALSSPTPAATGGWWTSAALRWRSRSA
ncbi:hypothetical protein DQ237_01335 [Blastococcus sp. TF02-8]|uniref:hypothetical protein n=1 Tax=Blastococcus sp. TF02-8 TaxID=2250574 RepID=UPI000DE8E55C|nr:hypothetical protein [Blastococcus sp. TF02-8]RBY97607.1 hypothetical protein DQ237_01335 [Blastococcus sp. TF02-8]